LKFFGDKAAKITRRSKDFNLLLIFDLDGTLIDSSEDLAISVNAMLRNAGRAEISRDLVQSYVGNGAAVLVRRAFGSDASEEEVADGLAFFLKFYRKHALEHTKLYPGVRDIVEQLSGQHTLAVLTNKPERISVDIIAALGLAQHFALVYGGDRFASKKPDPSGIEALMKDTGISQPETMMIGDTSIDVQTALNAGVRSCGVGWGFRPESFVSVPPDIFIRTPEELVHRLQSL
jgi:phosphoglycolate phosphatase